MEKTLKKHLQEVAELSDEWTKWLFFEDTNPDALSRDWLVSSTSFVYKVGVLAAIDRNKCDWVRVAIGIQRQKGDGIRVVGVLYFAGGENDDIGRVLDRARGALSILHPVFSS